MSNSETTNEKRTGSKPTQRVTREYHDVPETWMWAGRNDHARPGQHRFYAHRICHEHRLEAEPVGAGDVSYNETDALYVLYRYPDTGEVVERHYSAAVIETDADAVTCDILVRDEDGCVEPGNTIPIEYPTLEHPNENAVVLPRTVYRGEPRNFRATIAVNPEEQRVRTDE